MPGDDRDFLIRQGLKLRHLRLMAALEETGQISAAAAFLNMTQPVASRLLADLERLLGASLHDRHPRGITLTPTGRLLAARGRRLLSELDETGREIARLTAGTRGRVHVGSVTGPALELVLPAIREARVTLPEIEIAVQVGTSDELGERLLSGELDFYIGRLHDSMDARAVTLRPIGPEPISLIVRTGHPLTRRPGADLSDCLRYDWVMQPPGGLLRRTAEAYLLERGLPVPDRIVSTSSLLLTLAMIGGSNAVAPVARSVARFHGGRDGMDGRIVQLPIATDMAVVPYALVQPADRAPSPAAQTFLGLIEAKLSPPAARAGP
ncbi:DNA-binding transcriptional regulator, LysR family [Tranquillimonas rosea]|uniref:DNA-binding transcriptional regulator, LysR family n=1 Tax=Tranquillimonas rosea TaxID=641238 RepID=A0A1H9PGA3_9RHOB|nr:LysR family transcriptional regulator [Tranquillimonas rosea]SER46895.1 DNA-binding transcriptional regulator, LysR family [Tranquillimonas rosea]